MWDFFESENLYYACAEFVWTHHATAIEPGDFNSMDHRDHSVLFIGWDGSFDPDSSTNEAIVIEGSCGRGLRDMVRTRPSTITVCGTDATESQWCSCDVALCLDGHDTGEAPAGNPDCPNTSTGLSGGHQDMEGPDALKALELMPPVRSKATPYRRNTSCTASLLGVQRISKGVSGRAASGNAPACRKTRIFSRKIARVGIERMPKDPASCRGRDSYQGHLDKGVLAFHVLMAAAHAAGLTASGRSPLTFHKRTDKAVA